MRGRGRGGGADANELMHGEEGNMSSRKKKDDKELAKEAK